MILSTLTAGLLASSVAVHGALVGPAAADAQQGQGHDEPAAPKDYDKSPENGGRGLNSVDRYVAQWEELYEAYGFHSSSNGPTRAGQQQQHPMEEEPAGTGEDNYYDMETAPQGASGADLDAEAGTGDGTTGADQLGDSAVDQAPGQLATNTPAAAEGPGDLAAPVVAPTGSVDSPLESTKTSVVGLDSNDLPLSGELGDDVAAAGVASMAPHYYTPPHPSGYVSGTYAAKAQGVRHTKRGVDDTFDAFDVQIFRRQLDNYEVIVGADGIDTPNDDSYFMSGDSSDERQPLSDETAAGDDEKETIMDSFNDDLALDEYEFGYDVRDTYLGSLDNVDSLTVGIQNVFAMAEVPVADDSGVVPVHNGQDRKSRRRRMKPNSNNTRANFDHCGRPLNGTVMMKNVNGTLLGEPSNSTMLAGGPGSARVESMTGSATRAASSDAMLAMTVFVAVAVFMLIP